ncbi:MAG: sigma 54-interacting transcriptional regulator, partial [Pseudomonadota bacterium]|nr:sigma 54-interacting transcriptional regulator [Pseudomonadota bacterium]
LLRVLQERQVERLGAQHTIELDIRIIATSNRDLPAEVAAGRFREDLFYRLSVMPLRVAPLCERTADILPLARTALKAHAPEAVFSEAAIARLLEHDWPGNVRELHNVVQRASILAEGRVIDVRHLLFDLPTREHRSAANRISNAEEGGLRQHLRDEEVDRVLHALGHHPSRRAAAGALGISERTLRYKVARLRDEGVAIPLARQA